jgi:hypothetical protein
MSGIRKANAFLLVCSNMAACTNMAAAISAEAMGTKSRKRDKKGREKPEDVQEFLFGTTRKGTLFKPLKFQRDPQEPALKVQKNEHLEGFKQAIEPPSVEPECAAPKETKSTKWTYRVSFLGEKPDLLNVKLSKEKLQTLIKCKVESGVFEFSAEQQPKVHECEEGKEAVINEGDCPDPDAVQARCLICFEPFNADVQPMYHKDTPPTGGCEQTLCKGCLELSHERTECCICRRAITDGSFQPGFGKNTRDAKPLRVIAVANVEGALAGLSRGKLQLPDAHLLHAGDNDVTGALECKKGWVPNPGVFGQRDPSKSLGTLLQSRIQEGVDLVWLRLNKSIQCKDNIDSGNNNNNNSGCWEAKLVPELQNDQEQGEINAWCVVDPQALIMAEHIKHIQSIQFGAVKKPEQLGSLKALTEFDRNGADRLDPQTLEDLISALHNAYRVGENSRIQERIDQWERLSKEKCPVLFLAKKALRRLGGKPLLNKIRKQVDEENAAMMRAFLEGN